MYDSVPPRSFARELSDESLRMAQDLEDRLEAAGLEIDPDVPFTLRMEGDFELIRSNTMRLVVTWPVRRKA